jgi:hypothetical protein
VRSQKETLKSFRTIDLKKAITLTLVKAIKAKKSYPIENFGRLHSETGNTENIARAIYEEVSKEHGAHLKEIKQVSADTLNSYDLVFLGSACHSTDLRF